MFSLSKKQNIGEYIVTFPIKSSSYAETYRVKDNSGKNYFLKLFNYSKLHKTQFNEVGDVLEVSITKHLKHPNVVTAHHSGEIIISGQKMGYIIFDYISGETVAERLTREQQCSAEGAVNIIKGVLESLKYLHTLERPIIHNELTIQNIMLDMSNYEDRPKLIDFGYARYIDQGHKAFTKEGLNLYYLAPETFNGVFTVQSDIYSAGAILYHLIFGIQPFYIDTAKFHGHAQELEDLILNAKKKSLFLPEPLSKDIDGNLLNILTKALAYSVDDRFKTADEFLKALNGEIDVEAVRTKEKLDQETKPSLVKKGNGFADVAGMSELKEQLQSDVIDLLQDPDQAKALGLSLPNGILFYGPPGCGKTYFAEKFAEEVGCSYMYIKCSDVASPYIHGGQGKIAAVFEEARKNAPTIVFLDEIDAMLMDRSRQENTSMSGEVNEFLTHLNNCGSEGIIVIGATNKPTDIDSAALRAGRLELKYYIPQPDFESRKALFQLQLANRKVDFGIDYDQLANLTENYVSADIKLIVDTAARLVFRRKLKRITMEILVEAAKSTKPSLTNEEIKKHESIRDQFQGTKPEPRKK